MRRLGSPVGGEQTPAKRRWRWKDDAYLLFELLCVCSRLSTIAIDDDVAVDLKSTFRYRSQTRSVVDGEAQAAGERGAGAVKQVNREEKSDERHGSDAVEEDAYGKSPFPVSPGAFLSRGGMPGFVKAVGRIHSWAFSPILRADIIDAILAIAPAKVTHLEVKATPDKEGRLAQAVKACVNLHTLVLHPPKVHYKRDGFHPKVKQSRFFDSPWMAAGVGFSQSLRVLKLDTFSADVTINSFLVHLPLLESLDIETEVFAPTTFLLNKPVSLPHLHTLSFTAHGGSDVAKFISTLRLPVLRKLRLGLFFTPDNPSTEFDPLVTVIGSSLPALRSILLDLREYGTEGTTRRAVLDALQQALDRAMLPVLARNLPPVSWERLRSVKRFLLADPEKGLEAVAEEKVEAVMSAPTELEEAKRLAQWVLDKVARGERTNDVGLGRLLATALKDVGKLEKQLRE